MNILIHKVSGTCCSPLQTAGGADPVVESWRSSSTKSTIDSKLLDVLIGHSWSEAKRSFTGTSLPGFSSCDIAIWGSTYHPHTCVTLILRRRDPGTDSGRWSYQDHAYRIFVYPAHSPAFIPHCVKLDQRLLRAEWHSRIQLFTEHLWLFPCKMARREQADGQTNVLFCVRQLHATCLAERRTQPHRLFRPRPRLEKSVGIDWRLSSRQSSYSWHNVSTLTFSFFLRENININDVLGNFSLTLVDSLDSLIVRRQMRCSNLTV